MYIDNKICNIIWRKQINFCIKQITDWWKKTINIKLVKEENISISVFDRHINFFPSLNIEIPNAWSTNWSVYLLVCKLSPSNNKNAVSKFIVIFFMSCVRDNFQNILCKRSDLLFLTEQIYNQKGNKKKGIWWLDNNIIPNHKYTRISTD